MLNYVLDSAEATEALGARLAARLRPGVILYLSGDLGAGKTTLVRGLLHALGHHGTVKSPTYTLVEPYQIGDWRLFHWDLYRVTDPEELDFLGLRDQLDEQAILLIEWPEQGQGELPAADVEIALSYVGEGRACQLIALSSVGHTMLADLLAPVIAHQPDHSASVT
ncbi:MAG: tRNA threonylcarbamoyladenosine biosynthesis protein TsaE [Pseudomonadota bacterium]|nr:tRNA threonylcarbamoyladenosine biosynthesis protein TsaE [Pseudomonadota bacterium]